MERANLYYDYITKLSIHPFHLKGEVSKLAKEITKAICTLTGTERVGVWFFSDDRKILYSESIYVLSKNTYSDRLELPTETFPKYFSAIEKSRSFIVDNVFEEEGTSEFVESYFKPFGISSLLDSAIRCGEDLVGVICLEHVGEQKKWSRDEIELAGILADVLSNCVLIKREIDSQNKLLINTKLATMGELTAQILHEVGNPLSILQNALQVALERSTEHEQIDDKLVKMLHHADEGCKRILNIFHSMRHLINSNNVEVSKIELRTVLDDVFYLIGKKLEDHNVDFIRPIAHEEISLNINHSHFSQVLLNLINNSVDAMNEANIENKEIKIVTDKTKESFKISVINSGSISPEVANRLFKENFTTKGSDKGTGLGLSLCSRVMKSLDGSIEFDKENPDTKFDLILPLHRVF